jgi:hypothetical protein
MAGAAGSGNAYKVVEIGDVTDQEIEAALNRWVGEGYRFDSVHFVTQPGNRRPTMAFLFFARGDRSARE